MSRDAHWLGALGASRVASTPYHLDRSLKLFPLNIKTSAYQARLASGYFEASRYNVNNFRTMNFITIEWRSAAQAMNQMFWVSHIPFSPSTLHPVTYSSFAKLLNLPIY